MSNGSEPRILGLDVGDDATNFEAGMWLIGLIAILAVALPVAIMEPTLGFRAISSAFIAIDWKSILRR